MLRKESLSLGEINPPGAACLKGVLLYLAAMSEAPQAPSGPNVGTSAAPVISLNQGIALFPLVRTHQSRRSEIRTGFRHGNPAKSVLLSFSILYCSDNIEYHW